MNLLAIFLFFAFLSYRKAMKLKRNREVMIPATATVTKITKLLGTSAGEVPNTIYYEFTLTDGSKHEGAVSTNEYPHDSNRKINLLPGSLLAVHYNPEIPKENLPDEVLRSKSQRSLVTFGILCAVSVSWVPIYIAQGNTNLMGIVSFVELTLVFSVAAYLLYKGIQYLGNLQNSGVKIKAKILPRHLWGVATNSYMPYEFTVDGNLFKGIFIEKSILNCFPRSEDTPREGEELDVAYHPENPKINFPVQLIENTRESLKGFLYYRFAFLAPTVTIVILLIIFFTPLVSNPDGMVNDLKGAADKLIRE
jgi:hypothetical protein